MADVVRVGCCGLNVVTPCGLVGCEVGSDVTGSEPVGAYGFPYR